MLYIPLCCYTVIFVLPTTVDKIITPRINEQPNPLTKSILLIIIHTRKLLTNHRLPGSKDDRIISERNTPTEHKEVKCYTLYCILFRIGFSTIGESKSIRLLVVVVVFTLKTVLTSIQYPPLSYSSRQRNEFPWSQANPK